MTDSSSGLSAPTLLHLPPSLQEEERPLQEEERPLHLQLQEEEKPLHLHLQEERPLPDLYTPSLMRRVTDLSPASSTVHVKRPMNAFMVNSTSYIWALVVNSCVVIKA